MAHSTYLKFDWRTLKWLIIAGLIPPMYFQLGYLIKYDISKLNTINHFLFWTGVSVSSMVFLTIIVCQEIRIIDKYLPWKKTVVWRIVTELIITNITVISAMFFLSKFTYKWHCLYFKISFKAHLFQELTTGVILLTIILLIIEGSYFFTEWKKGLLLTEKLKEESLKAQLESLKNQVNPHFLFNSLNVLSSLVHKDADRAEEFIDQFASVYRYVLNIQDKMAVTLGEELDFINSYVFLQKIRFQEGFDVHIEIDEHCYSHYLVPLSLQMLVENAIKHNIISKEDPLLVQIYLQGDRVHVENRINLRKDENKSVGMGLKNLRERYFLLAGIMPEIKKEDGKFIANIPLIKPEKSEEHKYESECCNHRRRKVRGRKA